MQRRPDDVFRQTREILERGRRMGEGFDVAWAYTISAVGTIKGHGCDAVNHDTAIDEYATMPGSSRRVTVEL